MNEELTPQKERFLQEVEQKLLHRELDARRQSIANEIAKLSADAVPMEKMESISGYLDDWENVSFEDKRQVVDALITVIRATNEKVEIEWKI